MKGIEQRHDQSQSVIHNKLPSVVLQLVIYLKCNRVLDRLF